jgi:hypothetical protein
MGYFSGQKSKFVGRVEVTKPDRNPLVFFELSLRRHGNFFVTTKINRLYP